jgi:hypothetical protein
MFSKSLMLGSLLRPFSFITIRIALTSISGKAFVDACSRTAADCGRGDWRPSVETRPCTPWRDMIAWFRSHLKQKGRSEVRKDNYDIFGKLERPRKETKTVEPSVGRMFHKLAPLLCLYYNSWWY